MSEKHTPGPWAASSWGKAGDGEWMVETESVDQMICETLSEANAKFIAAAPEMLEALEGLADLGPLDGSDRTDAMCHVGIATVDKCAECQRHIAARKAIAKATGREAAE